MQRLAIAAYVIFVCTFPAEALIGQPGALGTPATTSAPTPVATQPAPEAPAPRT
jgi:hypothetical protein